MQELDRPDIFGHPEIWYKIGDGPPQLHILVARALPHVIHVTGVRFVDGEEQTLQAA